MKIIVSAMVLLLFVGGIKAQDNEALNISGEQNNALLLIVDHKEFGEQFCLHKTSDQSANYFAIDLEKLPSRFEQVYFINLVFDRKDIVSIDSDFEKDHLWLKAHKSFDVKEILDAFTSLKQKTDKANQEFSEQKKTLWLETNSKN
jgi:hypothetical protein